MSIDYGLERGLRLAFVVCLILVICWRLMKFVKFEVRREWPTI